MYMNEQHFNAIEIYYLGINEKFRHEQDNRNKIVNRNIYNPFISHHPLVFVRFSDLK